jgi:hypothetical protein
MFSRKLLTIAIMSSAVALSACNEKDAEKTAAEQPSTAVVASVAEDKAADMMVQEKPFISTSVSAVETATVTAIDQETRVVTLLNEDGNSTTFTAGDEVRNLAQVSTGDLVTIEYVKNLTVQVIDAPEAVPAVADVIAEVRAEEGEMPAAATIETMVEVSTIEAIDIEANTFKLKDENGVVTEYTARDPENLTRSNVGDVVVATLTEAMAISVSKATAE